MRSRYWPKILPWDASSKCILDSMALMINGLAWIIDVG